MILADEQATEELGRRIARTLRPGDIVALSGALGVGKTALARGILAALGHEGEVPSPSFAIIQPYDELELPVWHVDLFRIEDVGELEELGLEAAAEGVLLVEWPEKAGAAAWPQALGLTLEFAEGGARRLTAKVPPSWQSRWPPR
jgi:tRNA threonylcarbamoyladenosine biosynthesis protein TsaE